MTTDTDARMRADAEHWRQAEASRPSLPLQSALAAAIPELDARADTTVVELTSHSPSPQGTKHGRWLRAAIAAVVVVLAGTAAAVLGTTRHGKGPTASADLVGTVWLEPGAGTNGAGKTLSFDPAATKLTISDGCTTSPYHVIVRSGTLRIGGADGISVTCSPAAREPGLYPTAGDPSVAAQNALNAVLQGTVTWTISDHTLILRRGAKTATLYATTSIGQRCAVTGFTVTAAGATHQYPLNAQPSSLAVKAPADINAGATGPCRDAVSITLAPANRPDAWISHNRYGHWRVSQPGTYQLVLTLGICTPAPGECFGSHPLRLSVRVNP